VRTETADKKNTYILNMADNDLEAVWKAFRDINILGEQMTIRTCDWDLSYYHHAKFVDQKLVSPHDPKKAVRIPFKIIHAQLQRSENTLRHRLTQDYSKNGKYKHNLVTANIGFIVSCGYKESKTHTRRFITLPLMFPSEISTHSSKQFFTCQIKGVWDKSWWSEKDRP
jgi:ribosomal protein S19